ncbi:hypothetical protein [Litorivivens sp.]|uniref:hypothetical protein n=2 Tax=Litorivivens sp. TaxID=2020868 RepID=UPI0035656F10
MPPDPEGAESTTMLVHQEEILLNAPPSQVKAFIVTPERIMDYYPQGTTCGVFKPGESFYCQGKAGISLLESLPVTPADNGPLKVVLKVTTARGLKPPFSPEAIKHAAFFSMVEDWLLHPHGEGTRLVKCWRDVKKHRLRWLPIAFIVKQTAKAESTKLQLAWNQAAMAG